MFLDMMLKEKRDLRPLLVKFGVAVALSFAGFIYSQIKTRKTKPYLPPPPSPLASDGCSEVGSTGNDQSKDDFQALKMSATSNPEEMSMQRTSVDVASVGLSPSIRHSGDVFLPELEFNDRVEEFDVSARAGPSPKQEAETPRLDLDASRTFSSSEKDDYEQEIKHLRNMVGVLRERERNLEVQLLEYYGLKEQEKAVQELQSRLKIKNMEAKLFTLKIESLQSQNQKLKGQVSDHAKVVDELESARSRIKVLKKKLKQEAEQNREQIVSLQKRVSRLQEQEVKAPADSQDMESKLERLKVLEDEVEELRKSNRRLQIENSELAQKLESTQILANSVLEDPEREASNEMSNCLRKENEELKKQIEQLQADRCIDVEELVYLRWINACLRYELRNYQAPTGKTVARDLSRSLSPKSEERAKKLILEYAHTEEMGDRGMDIMDFDCDLWSSSQASYGTDTGEPDDSSFDNSSATRTTSSGKLKFFKNLRRLIRGKDHHHSKTDHPEDVDSLTWSSGRFNDSITMLQSHSERFTTPSGTSFDLPGWRSLNADHIKDVKRFRRYSEGGSHGFKRFILGNGDASDCPLEPQHEQDPNTFPKSDLLKFAEALKEPGPGRGKIHKRAASII